MLPMMLATNSDSNFSGLGHHLPKRLCSQTRCQGLCTEPAKMETAWANNASQHARLRNGGEAAMQ